MQACIQLVYKQNKTIIQDVQPWTCRCEKLLGAGRLLIEIKGNAFADMLKDEKIR